MSIKVRDAVEQAYVKEVTNFLTDRGMERSGVSSADVLHGSHVYTEQTFKLFLTILRLRFARYVNEHSSDYIWTITTKPASSGVGCVQDVTLALGNLETRLVYYWLP